MISTMGYRASNSPPYGKTQFELGLASPLQLSSSLFVASRRPSIPLSLKLLHFSTSPSGGTLMRLEDASRGHISKSIDQLPVEILCDIFSICDEAPGNQPSGSKVVLSHVCRRWRGIVLCMPVLWSRISVQQPNRTSVERLTAHFRRSGNCAISLTIIETTSSPLEQREAIRCVLPVIHTHASQIKSLRLRLRTSAPDFVSHLNGCQFSKLESLDLHLHLCPTEVTQVLVSSFQQGSRLSSLVWRKAENLPANISWAALTRVELNGSYTLNTVCNILRRCHDLQELILDSVDDDPIVDTAVILPALHTLNIHTQISLAHLFDCLKAPSLHTAYIRYRMDGSVSRDWDQFGAFLLRSGCKLRQLTLWDKGVKDSQLMQCLQLSGLQSLTYIDIQQPPISDNVLERLSYTDDRAHLLPCLEVIKLRECRSVDGRLKDFVSSRLAGGSLASLDVGLSEGHGGDKAYLGLLQDTGRNIRIYR